MKVYIESGLRVNLPKEQHFRFQDCEIYKQLSGQKLKEMDFGWWQKEQNRLWLIEIKDYAHLTTEERLPNHLLDNLVDKATDSLLMLASCWIKTGKGREFSGCLPKAIQQFPEDPEQLK